MAHIVITLLILFGLTEQQILCQDALRPGEREPQRTIHSQRHLSHRMMHFGKRLDGLQAPQASTANYEMQVGDQVSDARYPYLLSIELDRGQTLQAVPEVSTLDLLRAIQLPQRQREQTGNVLYDIERPAFDLGLVVDQQQPRLAQQQVGAKPFDAAKFMRLMKGSADGQTPEHELSGSQGDEMSGGGQLLAANNESVSGVASIGDSLGQSHGSLSGNQAISISSRSVPPMTRGNTLNIPKAYISTLLYSRPGAAAAGNSFGASYNKKAEPKNNLFMHFGRRK